MYELWHPFLYMYAPAVHSTVTSIQINKQHAYFIQKIIVKKKNMMVCK